LIPTLQAPRFGLPSDERDAFTAAYGQDVRTWDGYPEPTARTHRATSRLYAHAELSALKRVHTYALTGMFTRGLQADRVP
jgi:hypothetical protein